MAYCTKTDIIMRISEENLAELVNDVPNSEESHDYVLTALIAAADAEINSIVSERYTVPFSTVPSRIKDISVIITVYYAQLRRFSNVGVSSEWKEQYKSAIEELRRYAAGEQVLPSATDTGTDDTYLTTPTHFMDFEDEDNPVSFF